jgi:hypothetical protein
MGWPISLDWVRFSPCTIRISKTGRPVLLVDPNQRGPPHVRSTQSRIPAAKAGLISKSAVGIYRRVSPDPIHKDKSMRFRTARAAILVVLAIGLAGCSTTRSSTADSGTKSAWWRSLSLKRKVDPASSVAAGVAPMAPNFNSTAATSTPTVAMPGGYAATGASYQGGTQYPVTPYPPTSVPCAAAGCAAGAASYAAGAVPSTSNGYMPPSNPYAQTAAASNPYATTAPVNPYAAATAPSTNRYASPPANAIPPASPYAAGTTQTPAYTAAGPYNAPQ